MQFHNKSKAAYNACIRNGWFDQICGDMPVSLSKCPPSTGKVPYVSEVPELMKMWSKEDNRLGLASTTKANSRKVVAIWICPKCGEKFPRPVSNVYHGTIYCHTCTSKKNAYDYIDRKIKAKGSLEDNYPELVAYWDFEKNKLNPVQGKWLPSQFLSGSNEEVFWKCKYCNYGWKKSILRRIAEKHLCPNCYETKQSLLKIGEEPITKTHPHLLRMWSEENTISPDKISAHDSTNNIKWVCPKGHKWKKDLSYMTHTTDKCPICQRELQTSFPEQTVYFYLKQVANAVNQKEFDGIKGAVDIYLPDLNVVIQYDGKHWHKGKKAAEDERDLKLNEIGTRTIRIKEDVKNEVIDDFIYYDNRDKKKYKNLPFAINATISMLNLSPVIIDIEKDKQLIWEQYRTFERENSVAIKFPYLLEEWCYEKNGNLDPYCFSYGTNSAVWWKCKKNPNHLWPASISSRKTTGCPFCAGVRFFPGENDLATKRPDLVKEWDFEANGDLTPDKVAFGDSTKVMWICKDCNHHWPVAISSRSLAGTGCPKCAKKKRLETRHKTLVRKHGSFADNHPDLLLDWDYCKNKIDPKDIPSRIIEKVWWKCHTCDHEWEDSPDGRVGKKWCPKCYENNRARLQRLRNVTHKGSFITSYPHLLLDWDYEKNVIPPEEFTEGSSHPPVNWKCHLCGHTWPGPLYKRTKLGHRCPKCKGKGLD